MTSRVSTRDDSLHPLVALSALASIYPSILYPGRARRLLPAGCDVVHRCGDDQGREWRAAQEAHQDGQRGAGPRLRHFRDVLLRRVGRDHRRHPAPLRRE
eukprot:scaffold44107_cov61-Phaeocystis_antarctica.AAC.1